jgi:hypothetical protein
MKQDALRILERISGGKTRQRRGTILMRSPTEADPDWFMYVPICFNAALDIQQTTRVIHKRETLMWTQGVNFSFSTGDRIYDTSMAYDQWSEALKVIRYCMHVTQATGESITFEVLVPTSSRNSLQFASAHTVKQDEFVLLLVTGACPDITLSHSETLL